MTQACKRSAIAALLLVVFCGAAVNANTATASRPKVRAITAFVHLDRARYEGQISEALSVLGDVASLAWKWKKPLTARLLLVQGKRAGDSTSFGGPYLFNTTLQPLP